MKIKYTELKRKNNKPDVKKELPVSKKRKSNGQIDGMNKRGNRGVMVIINYEVGRYGNWVI